MKKPSVLTNPVPLLFLSPLIFSISCTQQSFVCWNEQKTKAVSFAFDETMNSVTVKDIYQYSTLDSSNKPLSSHMPGGTHRLKMNKDSITLEVIQDTVFTKTRLPSGRFIKSHTEIKTQNDYLKQRRYHAVYPVIHKYIFEKKSLKLSLFYSPLPKPRSAIEQEFIHDKTTNDLHPKKTKDLSPEELTLIFPPHEKTTPYIYPDCKKEESYSLKRTIRTILKYFYSVYSVPPVLV